MPKSILIVDDSATMTLSVKSSLEMNGFVVQAASDGLKAVAKLKDGFKPDLIITDINMPNMDGFGFIEGVRKSERHCAIPILVLTTESDAEKKQRARDSGATGWIVKPFDPVKLIDAIRRVAA